MGIGGFRPGRALRPEATLIRSNNRIPSPKRQRCDPALIAVFFRRLLDRACTPLGIMIRTSNDMKNRLIGGETLKYTKFRTESRDQAFNRMIKDADGLGADAAADVRFSTSMVIQGAVITRLWHRCSAGIKVIAPKQRLKSISER